MIMNLPSCIGGIREAKKAKDDVQPYLELLATHSQIAQQRLCGRRVDRYRLL